MEMEKTLLTITTTKFRTNWFRGGRKREREIGVLQIEDFM